MSTTVEPSGELLRLGALEAQVMEVLWDHGPATVREVITQLLSTPAYTTIATVLTNLDRKGMVLISRHHRCTRYAPRVSRHEHAARLMEQVLSASRDRAASILHFVESMPAEDLDMLRGYLANRDLGQDG